MELYLMRHGLAEEPIDWMPNPESERPLTKKGRKEVKRVAKRLRDSGVEFEAIFSSSFERAFATAEIVAKVFKMKKHLEIWEPMRAGGDAHAVVRLLTATKRKKVLLVGHEPDLGRLVALLVTGDRSVSMPFEKAGVAKLVASKISFGRCARLEWMVPPELL